MSELAKNFEPTSDKFYKMSYQDLSETFHELEFVINLIDGVTPYLTTKSLEARREKLNKASLILDKNAAKLSNFIGENHTVKHIEHELIKKSDQKKKGKVGRPSNKKIVEEESDESDVEEKPEKKKKPTKTEKKKPTKTEKKKIEKVVDESESESESDSDESYYELD